MKVKCSGFVMIYKDCDPAEPVFEFCRVDLSAHGYVMVGPQEVEFDIPDNFDPRAGMIDALKTEKTTVLAKAQAEADKIDWKIGKLLALEHHE